MTAERPSQAGQPREAIEAAFRAQRAALEGWRTAVRGGVALGRAGSRTLLSPSGPARAGLAATELARAATRRWLDAAEATGPGSGRAFEELRGAVDEQFDAVADCQAALLASGRRGAETLEPLSEASLAALDAWVDALLAAHGTVEASTLRTLDRLQPPADEWADVEPIEIPIEE